MSATLGVVPRPQWVRVSGPGPTLTPWSLDRMLAPDGWRHLGQQFRRDVGSDGTLPVAGRPSGGPAIEVRHVAELPVRIPAARGLVPAHDVDERFTLTVDRDGIVIEATHGAGARHALTTVRHLLADAAVRGTPGRLPGILIEDGPRFSWRGLTLDVARTFIAPADVKRIVDLAALYRLSVLHLHLTDDQGWRIEIPGLPELTENAEHYSVEDWNGLVQYAEGRGITLVPEIDLPGHCAALLRAFPACGPDRGGWLDPTRPGALAILDQVLRQVAAMTRGRHVHIGGDETFGMPDELFAAVVRHARAVIRDAGRRPVGWQEAARAGLGADDVIQHWMVVDTDRAVVERALAPEVLAAMEASLAGSDGDLASALAAGAPVISSPAAHAYLDRPYAEPGLDPGQEERRARLGLRAYTPAPVSTAYRWDPAAMAPRSGAMNIGGVGAALWSETVRDIDDLGFLLLPRLASIAEVAWSGTGDWDSHADALAIQPHLWEAHGWRTWFRSSLIAWRMSR
ncbi:family 20 glycosylhydrolase [Streptomyces sp. NPDC058221]|uniref:family 20 glycosylhydrolase n=1 Tax=Streptomyces sp. NPDC058221 TaxID=3346388 RepID=UPI0036E288F7